MVSSPGERAAGASSNSRASPREQCFPNNFQKASSDRAVAHVQAKNRIQGLDLSLVVGGVVCGVSGCVWCAFAAEFRYYSSFVF